MRKKFCYTLISIFVLFLSSCYAQSIQKDSQRLFVCDSQTVYLSILKSEKLRPYFPKSLGRKYYDSVNHVINLQVEGDTLLKDIVFYYNKAKDTTFILKTISDWCANNKFIDSLGTQSDKYPPEAILYNTNDTRFLVMKFIKSPKQDWESLSTYQQYELNLNFLEYIDRMTERRRKALFSELGKTALKLTAAKR